MQYLLEPGAELLLNSDEFTEKLSGIKAFISDWDGVFNAGIKQPGVPSPFAEADSMGINMLRLEGWLRTGQIPKLAIITGANNPVARYLARREKFVSVYSGIKNKAEALMHFCEMNQLKTREVACFFDDINDLSMASLCGLRFLVRREAGKGFMSFIRSKQLVDYRSAHPGDQYAIREICEFLIQVNNDYDEVISHRIAFEETYQQYWQERQSIPTHFYQVLDSEIREVQEDN